MAHTKLSLNQIIFRTIFMIVAVVVVCWALPHQEAFRYEYEVGKPWRYGRLVAPYDFPVYRSDSAVKMMEDSLHARIIPSFVVDEEVADRCLRRAQSARSQFSSEAYRYLLQRLSGMYSHGILLPHDQDPIVAGHFSQVQIRAGNISRMVPVDSLLTEREAYEALRNDTLYSYLFSYSGLRSFIEANLAVDTVALQHEYYRIRQDVSAARDVVLAESRIIDQGDIVTPALAEVLDSFHREQQSRRNVRGSYYLMMTGHVVLVSLLLCSILLFLFLYRPWLYALQKETMVAVLLVVLMVVLTSLASRYLFAGGVYLVPLGIVTVVLATFHGSRTAFHGHTVMVLLCSFVAPSHFEYLVIQEVTGMVIVFALKDGLVERAQLMHVFLLSLLSYIGLYAMFTLANEGTLSTIPLPTLAMMACNSLLLLMSYLIIYGLERTFGFMSDVTLVELCNVGGGLLLKLQQEANGTYNHSMNVANLAAAAAKEVGAKASLVRTGALYHDIGKLWNPSYYVENQTAGMTSVHTQLTPEESAENIKKHVTEGIRIAREAGLPNEIIQFIATHHGRSLVKYFYTTWCNSHPDEEPDREIFTYVGPDPTTTEQAILMMADAVEAAARSLKDPTIANVTELVDKIVNGQVNTGRFNDAKITLHQIQLCKQSFVHSLEGIYHGRIAYPERIKK